MFLTFAYTWRGVLVAPPVMLATVCFWHEYENDVFVWPLGLVLFLGGWVLRVWAQQHVCYRLKTTKALTTSGPYTVVRNPIYLGNTLIVLGVVVMFAWQARSPAFFRGETLKKDTPALVVDE